MIKTTLIKFSFILILLSSLSADSLSLIAVGDIMMGSTYPESNLPPNRGRDLFTNAVQIIKEADLSIGNLESTLLTGGKCVKKIDKGRVYAFRTPPDFAQNLADAGFKFMNLANNHMNDFGPEGIESTIRALMNVGIKYGGPDRKIGKFEIGDKKIAVICFSTSPGSNTILEIEKAQQIVAKNKQKNDIVIVSFHGGGEGINYLHTRDTLEYFMGRERGNVVKFSRAVIDSGADFVFGHGPHVPRAMEIYRGRLIAYSLGNFCTWGFNLADQRGYAPILKIVLDSTGTFKHGEIISAIQKPYKGLEIDLQFNAAKLIRNLSIEDFPNSSPQITDQGLILPRKEN